MKTSTPNSTLPKKTNDNPNITKSNSNANNKINKLDLNKLRIPFII